MTEQRQSIEEIVRADSHVVEIIPSEYNWFPPIMDGLWKGERKTAEKLIKMIQTYLLLPYIVDDFESDHRERRIWRIEGEKRHHGFEECYSKNALKWNKYATTQTAIDLLLTLYTGPNKEQAAAYKTSFREKSDEEYNKKTTREKMQWVMEKKRQMYSLLEFLSENFA
ncbi:hypothetical protein HZA99_06415 [Candidatus Woesearchaeota archaeon]|nr:hypothetical protein [Candidatus Woesearchaeota archaeon]